MLANGRISMRVRPEVSELSSQGAITVNGFQVPALTVRRTETTVELGSGQSMMIAGLMSNGAQNTLKKLPGAGDLPIVGALFRSTNFRKGETELVIVVTPYLVQPVNANEIKLPTDGFQSPNIAEQILGNQESAGKSGAARPMPRSAPDQNGGTPTPRIGELDLPAPIQNPRPGNGEKSPAQGKRRAKTAEAAPGFDL